MKARFTLWGPDGGCVTLDVLALKQHVATLSGPGTFRLEGTCLSCKGTGQTGKGSQCPRCIAGRLDVTFATADALRTFVNPTT